MTEGRERKENMMEWEEGDRKDEEGLYEEMMYTYLISGGVTMESISVV